MSCTDVYRPAKDFAFESTFEEPMDEFYEDDNGDHVWCSIYLDEIVSSPFFLSSVFSDSHKLHS